MALVFIAKYVARKSRTANDTQFYFDKYGAYFKQLNTSSLTFSVSVSDSVCQWVIYSYILLQEINSSTCRKLLCITLIMTSF